MHHSSSIALFTNTIDRSSCPNLVQDALKVNALRALDGQTQCAIPDELCERSETTADTEGSSVVERLLEAVVVEEDTRGGVYVRVGVLSLRILLALNRTM